MARLPGPISCLLQTWRPHSTGNPLARPELTLLIVSRVDGGAGGVSRVVGVPATHDVLPIVSHRQLCATFAQPAAYKAWHDDDEQCQQLREDAQRIPVFVLVCKYKKACPHSRQAVLPSSPGMDGISAAVPPLHTVRQSTTHGQTEYRVHTTGSTHRSMTKTLHCSAMHWGALAVPHADAPDNAQAPAERCSPSSKQGRAQWYVKRHLRLSSWHADGSSELLNS